MTAFAVAEADTGEHETKGTTGAIPQGLPPT
jgi:hypothetical protein